MSRYTEIETAAHHAYEKYLYENSQDFANGIGIGFRRGAEWADKTMIEKACEWLKQHHEDYYQYDAWGGECVNLTTLIQDFKKAMTDE